MGRIEFYAYPLGIDKIACGSDLFKALLGRKETGVDIRGDGGYVIAWGDLTVEIIDSLLEWPVNIEEALRRDKEASEAQYKREHPRQHHEARPDDLERARNALEALPADHYDDWIKVGMALKAAFGDAGRQLWDAWSGTSTKFDKRSQEKHWRSFKRDGIGLGSLFALAKQSGYQHGRVDRAGSRTNGEFAWQSNDCIDSALSGHSGKNQIEAERSKHFWGDPQTIEAPLHPLPEFDGETLLPAALLEFVMDAADRMPCAPEYVAASVFTAAGSVIGARCAIKPKRFDDWSVVPNLWGGIVGPPSAKKSPAAGEGMKPVDRLIRKAVEAHKEALKGFEAESVIRDARQKALQAEIDVAAKKERLSSEPRAKDLGSLKVELLAASAEQDDEPTVRRFRTNDTTVEKLGELLRDNPAGLLVMRDELVGLLSSWDKEGREGDRTFFLEGWNGNAPFDTDRIGRGSILIPNHCVSIFGGIQPDKLIMYLEQASNALANDGMLQRFQMLVYPDPVQWEYRDRVPNQAAREKVYELFATLADFVPTAYGACPADEFNRFPSFQFDDEAQELYIEWATDLHRKIDREDNQLIAQHLAKYDKLFPALALIFHLMNRATGGSQIAVTRDCALRAAAWCTFLEAHARRCYRLLADNGLRAAQALAAKIQTGALADGFTARDVRLKQWRYLTKDEGITSALDWLEDSGWLRPEQVGGTGPGSGRRTTRYRVNPKIAGGCQ